MGQARQYYNLVLKVWWHYATLFAFTQYNLTFINPSPSAEACLLVSLTLLRSATEEPPWGDETRIELGPALQQADALPIELLRPLIELRRTLTELRRTPTKLRRTLTELRRNLTELRRNLTELRHILADVRRTLTELRRTLTELRCTLIELRRTLNGLRRTLTELRRTWLPPLWGGPPPRPPAPGG